MELLVMAVDHSHSNPVKGAGCYKVDDIVQVERDGFAWQKEEDPATWPGPGPAPFKIVRVPGADHNKHQHLVQREFLIGQTVPTGRRRLWSLNTTGLDHSQPHTLTAIQARFRKKG